MIMCTLVSNSLLLFRHAAARVQTAASGELLSGHLFPPATLIVPVPPEALVACLIQAKGLAVW